MLREPLGSEIVAHFEVDAPPALTEDVRELARDVGQESTVQTTANDDDTKATMVGRFGPRSRIRNGDVIDVAVDHERHPFLRPRNRSRHLWPGLTPGPSRGKELHR